MMDNYPWVERHIVFLHNRDEVNAFIAELLEEAERKFGPKTERPIAKAPDLVAHIPMVRKATIVPRDGWWFRYVVYRTHGIGIPERSTSRHRSLKGAERAVKRWEAKMT